ncbi:Uncharacterised protein [Suttonella ornithocola]|uniref:Uncharacterized protein n=1 Tax=Suttonella ornithocola TaxID=279832 RepID=A0A380MPN7_9GAMM|nr:Uncharacterised protein [Suttonella ornithocola]
MFSNKLYHLQIFFLILGVIFMTTSYAKMLEPFDSHHEHTVSTEQNKVTATRWIILRLYSNKI